MSDSLGCKVGIILDGWIAECIWLHVAWGWIWMNHQIWQERSTSRVYIMVQQTARHHHYLILSIDSADKSKKELCLWINGGHIYPWEPFAQKSRLGKTRNPKDDSEEVHELHNRIHQTMAPSSLGHFRVEISSVRHTWTESLECLPKSRELKLKAGQSWWIAADERPYKHLKDLRGPQKGLAPVHSVGQEEDIWASSIHSMRVILGNI